MPAEQGEDAWTESCSVDNVDVVGDMEASSSIAVCRLQNMRFGKEVLSSSGSSDAVGV